MIMFGYKTLDLKQFDLKMDHGKYYFDIILIGENTYHIDEISLKLDLPISLDRLDFTSDIEDYLTWERPNWYVDLGFGKLPIKDNIYEIKRIKEKEQTMTLAEIEEKLGYKINLVSESGRE